MARCSLGWAGGWWPGQGTTMGCRVSLPQSGGCLERITGHGSHMAPVANVYKPLKALVGDKDTHCRGTGGTGSQVRQGLNVTTNLVTPVNRATAFTKNR